MSWKKKTWWIGGGDIPSNDIRIYRYKFKETFWTRFRRSRATIKLPFTTQEMSTKGDENGHRAVLANPDFMIHGRPVMEWAYEVVKTGKATFEFAINAGDPFEPKQVPSCTLQVWFSDKGIASLFKLTFGGK